ncbi:hypothetical protein W97_03243 [Coniosporium apollinis CBS 100218]|uniref:Large ribosomal subunit protein uL15/eL18 domain-containing protein n=1 Tax=Coniosporium apollinis (strain CBS 100218) TaxID=1168221 RepID=R7YQ90_CONA1|nr:uncharacterized protein W97_03243 [Coniosporium apollinis CBS 100218]EON64013.1 hypothetical protein W97_03243 [Coniosporium apollinis CBS 100218]
MPPRLSLLKASSWLSSSSCSPVAPFLVPFLQRPQQQRFASILGSLSDNPGAYNKKIRRGRGPASGKGKTSGRGHKGQKQHGKVPRGFTGGQTKYEITHPERGLGFENHWSVEMSPLNVDRLQSWIDQGRINPSRPITMKELNDSRCLHGVKDGVKLLARGSDQLRTPINIIVSRASATAIAAVEAAGGKITTRFYTPQAIRRVLRRSTDPLESLQMQTESSEATPDVPRRKFAYRLPDPTSRKDIEYYRDPAHRGYLSYSVGEGESPSLFFKTPGQSKMPREGVPNKRKAAEKAAENKLW